MNFEKSHTLKKATITITISQNLQTTVIVATGKYYNSIN